MDVLKEKDCFLGRFSNERSSNLIRYLSSYSFEFFLRFVFYKISGFFVSEFVQKCFFFLEDVFSK